MDKLFAFILLNNSFLEDELKSTIFQYYNLLDEDYSEIERRAKELVQKGEGNSADSVYSIFSAIISTDRVDPYYFTEACFSVGKEVFPKEEAGNNESLLDRYEAQVKKIFEQKLSLNQFAENLFYLQKFYLSNYTPYENTLKTLSQFEWIKSLSAFSQVLYKTTNSSTHPFLMFCGDLSGIQDFIYDIHSSKAYKSLKGRSFYLQLLVESVIEHILDQLSLPVSNVIYSSGGKFYLLLANTEDTIQKLSKVKKNIQTQLLAKSYLDIYVCMDWIPFGIGAHYNIITDDKQNGGEEIVGLGDLWKAVSEKAAQDKARKFDRVLVEKYEAFFEQDIDNYNGVDTATCAVTGIPVPMKKENKLNPHDYEDETYVASEVQEQIELGKKLRHCNVVLLSNKPFDGAINPLSLNRYFGLIKLDKVDVQDKSVLLNPESEKAFIDFIDQTRSTKFIFYGGNKPVLTEDYKIANLEDIVKNANSSNSLNKIGVLKMDVDNLGQLFTKGFKDNSYQTFAAMSDLSNRLDWFFSGYINTIRNHEKFARYVNIIYSGGDDICAVGRWDKVLEFASKVRNDFKEYVSNKEHVSLSAGYIICNPKFPITKAIGLAEEELENAKAFKLSNNAEHKPDKNAISLFGKAIYWQTTVPRNQEWSLVLKLQEYFYEKLISKDLSKGFIYQLHSFDIQKERGELDWQWRSAYYFARLSIQDKQTKKEMKLIRNAIITGQLILESKDIDINIDSNRFFVLLIVALKLADYQTR